MLQAVVTVVINYSCSAFIRNHIATVSKALEPKSPKISANNVASVTMYPYHLFRGFTLVFFEEQQMAWLSLLVEYRDLVRAL